MTSTTGERVQHARKAAGLTQFELAQRIGCGRASIARIEAGHLPNLKMALAIAETLNRTVDSLFAPQPGRPDPLRGPVRASEVEGPTKRARAGAATGPETASGGRSDEAAEGK